MRIAKIIAAAALAFAGIAGTTASAAPVTVISASAAVQDYGYRDSQRYRGDRDRWERRDRWDRRDRRDRNWDRGRGYDRGRYYRGHRSHRACWNEWRRGHRVTVCRRR